MRNNRPHSIPVKPYSQYYTFQVNFELYPKDSISIDGCFSKAILYGAAWLRSRMEDSPDPGIDYLAEYPLPEEFASFRPEDLHDLNQKEYYDFGIEIDKERMIWALRFYESSSNENAHGQTFVTEISIYKEESSVLMAIRTSCREPFGAPPAEVFRLNIIRHAMIEDPDIIITEAFTGRDYPVDGKPILVNGRSKDACRDFAEKMLRNPLRQMPLVIMTDADLYDSNKELIDKFTYELTAHAHVVILSGGLNKLFYTILQWPELGDTFKRAAPCFAVFDGGADVRQVGYEPAIYDAANERGELEQSLDFVRDDLIKYLRGKVYDFGDIEFYSAVQVNKLLNQIGDGGGFDRTELESAISDLMEKLDSAQANETSLSANLQNLQQQYDDLQKAHNKSVSDLEKAHLQIREQERAAKLELQEAEKELAAEKDKLSSAMQALQSHACLFNMPASSNREDILRWIEESYCGEDGNLILHDRARNSFLNDNTNRDFNRLCLMFHFINGYTRFLNEGNGPEAANELAAEYDVLDNHFQITPSGRSTGALQNYKEDYQIDISSFNPKKKLELMYHHLKKGKGMDSDAIRIYFHYDSDIKRSIIGFFPDHLPM